MFKKPENVGDFLKNAGIKPSIQRLRIYDFLSKSMEHPTVETIFKALSPEIPTLSKTTVYNTLKLFQEHGIIMVVNIEDNETRYDADTSFHGHFKCTKCGRVYDFPLSLEHTTNIGGLENHTITESHYYLKGICSNCKSK
jgi:Fe2+ or Zn2+ uptake regulation protein